MIMNRKPTYEELEQRVNNLEKDVAKCVQAEAELMKFIIDSDPDALKHITIADGKEVWLQTIKVPQVDDNKKVIGLAGFSKNNTELKWAQQIKAAQLRLIKYATDHTVMEFLQKFLDEAEMLTKSKIGFYHFLEDDQRTLSLQTWSTNTLENMCTATGTGLHYPISEAGVWVDCVRERRPVVHNDYGSLPNKKGLPEGHAPIIRELVVPVFRGQKIVAILGVGNKRTDYNEHDVNVIQQLADLAWETVTHKRAEIKIRKLNETLEQRITERTAELENRTQLLQQLALELSSAEDRERQYIASILHDDFQQQLAYIKMELGLIRKKVDQEVRQKLDRLTKLTSECIEKTRNLSYELHPPALHHSGLLAALNVLAEDMKRKQGLLVTVRTDPDAEPASLSLASILYRSIRELLFNVAKHAGVDSVVVEIRRKNGLICLSIEDCGVGFDLNTVKVSRNNRVGFGLFSIEDRMTSLGGSMKIRTEPGKGCCVVLTLPKSVSRKIDVAEAALEKTVQTLVRDVPAKPIHPIVEKSQIRVLLADDHKLMREALANFLKGQKGLTIVGQAMNGREAVDLAAKLKPHVILMDVSMPELNGIEATAQIARDYSDIQVIGLSVDNDDDTRQKMLNAGAKAYLSKTESPDTLIESIMHVYCGKEEFNGTRG
jgi:signal transduction histidine kinase/CheY-like chemotaxis protein